MLENTTFKRYWINLAEISHILGKMYLEKNSRILRKKIHDLEEKTSISQSQFDSTKCVNKSA